MQIQFQTAGVPAVCDVGLLAVALQLVEGDGVARVALPVDNLPVTNIISHILIINLLIMITCSAPRSYPSCRQTTCASLKLKSSSHTPPQLPFTITCINHQFTGPEIITCHGLWPLWVINLLFVHPQKAGVRDFFHPVSHNPWEVIISGPV